MVFWGTVVKPGSPFTLSDNRRLHLSQATLGVGSATAKSIVQCNVGDKTPLFLCTLVPEKTECCPLNLKYEEADEVVFSVIGSRSVHLTGYFEENSTNFPNNDDDDKTESFGEDIPETETERSETDDDDEYGGSFINDDDIEVFPTSPAAEVGKKSGRKKRRKLKRKCRIVESDNDDCSPVTATSKLALPNGEIDETSNKKDDTRLMKCHRSEPNNDNCSPVNATPKLFGIFDVSDSEEEDPRPIGTHLKHNRAFKSLRIDSVGVERVNANSKNNLTEKESGTVTLSLEDDLAALKPESDAGMESVLGSKHDRLKDTVDNGGTPVPKVDNNTDDADACKSLHETVDNNNVKIDHKSHHPDVAEDSLENSIEELDGFVHTLPLSTQLGSDDDEQKKQRKKKKLKTAEDCFKDVSNEVDHALKNGKLESDANAGMESVLGSEHDRLKDTVDNGGTPVPKVDNKTDDADACKSLDETVDNNNVKIDHKSHHPDMAEDSLENSIEELDGFVHTLPLSTQLGSDDDEQKKQRKKKKRKTAEDCFKDVSNEVDHSLKNGKLDSDAVFLISEDKSCLQSQQKERKRKKRNNSNINDVEMSKKLPHGVVIEEQEIGNPDSKIATMGKRVRVHYVVKSLESGEVLLSNLDQAPLKFRLGAEGHDGWELGIEGMRVGGRRRISVPTSFGSLTEGASGEAAPNSAFVYEVELVKVL